MGLDTISQIITTKEALIAFIVVSCISVIETGIIIGLVKRVGSLRDLFSVTAFIRGKRSQDTNKKRHDTRYNIKNKNVLYNGTKQGDVPVSVLIKLLK